MADSKTRMGNIWLYEFKERHQREMLWRYSTVVGCVKESLFNSVGSSWQPSSAELLTESALLKSLASVSF